MSIEPPKTVPECLADRPRVPKLGMIESFSSEHFVVGLLPDQVTDIQWLDLGGQRGMDPRTDQDGPPSLIALSSPQLTSHLSTAASNGIGWEDAPRHHISPTSPSKSGK